MKQYFYAENAEVFPGLTIRTKAAEEYERFIHRTIYPYTIHPHSKFRVYWEIAMLVFAIYQLLPFYHIWFFASHDSIPYQLILNVMLLICLVDLVLMFFTGYVDGETEIVVLDPKRIMQRYLFRTFFPDFLSCLPLEVIFCAFYGSWEGIATSPSRREIQWYFIVFPPGLQIHFRIFTFIRYLRNTSKVMFWNPFITNLVIILSFFIFLMNFHISIFVLDLIITDPPQFKVYFSPAYGNSLSLISIPYSLFFEIYSFNQWFNFIRFPIGIVCFFSTLYLTAYFVKYMRYRMKRKERFYTLDTNVRIFTRKNRLPSSIKHKTLLYFKVFIQSKHYKEKEMFNYFPETFKSDVFSHLSLSLVKGFYAFQELPTYVLRRLAESLRYQLYLPNEVVMMREEKELILYFVQSGTVALYTTNNTEVYHFEDGGSFNGKHFLSGNLPKELYAISIEVSEVYKLYHKDFLEIMSSYPKLLERMKEMYYRDMLDEDI